MELALMLAIFLAGIILIVKGGDYFVDAASWIAEVSGVPKLIVGATIVSLATTLPEMLVSLMAAAQGKVDMAVGNAAGSVTANIGLIMALSVLCMPVAILRGDYLLKSALMLAAAGIVAWAGYRGEVGLRPSLLLLGIFGAFLFENVRCARRSMRYGGAGCFGLFSGPPRKRELLFYCAKFTAGAAAVVLGADLLVDSGSALARLAGVSERVVGVTIVAVGTSLPELVTTVTAVAKRQSALSVGNILGANILDLTLILPMSALAAGKALPVSAASARLDLPVCLLAGCVALLPAMATARFRRWQGVALLAIYAAYLVLTCRT
ncbi:MAG: calcium/sodium antiporter [Oscillospiraceae bacterium]|nr:calcium/sodium antiporter [Oscillospiraceae bacterium]